MPNVTGLPIRVMSKSPLTLAFFCVLRAQREDQTCLVIKVIPYPPLPVAMSSRHSMAPTKTVVRMSVDNNLKIYGSCKLAQNGLKRIGAIELVP